MLENLNDIKQRSQTNLKVYLKCAQQKSHISTDNLNNNDLKKKKLRFDYSLNFKEDEYDTENREEWRRDGEVR